jgi:hypothetical protein
MEPLQFSHNPDSRPLSLFIVNISYIMYLFLQSFKTQVFMHATSPANPIVLDLIT